MDTWAEVSRPPNSTGSKPFCIKRIEESIKVKTSLGTSTDRKRVKDEKLNTFHQQKDFSRLGQRPFWSNKEYLTYKGPCPFVYKDEQEKPNISLAKRHEERKQKQQPQTMHEGERNQNQKKEKSSKVGE